MVVLLDIVWRRSCHVLSDNSTGHSIWVPVLSEPKFYEHILPIMSIEFRNIVRHSWNKSVGIVRYSVCWTVGYRGPCLVLLLVVILRALLGMLGVRGEMGRCRKMEGLLMLMLVLVLVLLVLLHPCGWVGIYWSGWYRSWRSWNDW